MLGELLCQRGMEPREPGHEKQKLAQDRVCGQVRAKNPYFWKN